MKRIAAITMVRGDAFYLRKWTAWYGGQFGEENLYILLDGRDQPLPDWCPKAHVIPCDRVGGQVARADKGRIERISDEAARLFAEGYDLVIGTDADEMLAVDPRLGVGLAEFLSGLDVRTAVSGLGLDVGQKLGEEADITADRPFLEQRHYAQLGTRYTKASVAYNQGPVPVPFRLLRHETTARAFRRCGPSRAGLAAPPGQTLPDHPAGDAEKGPGLRPVDPVRPAVPDYLPPAVCVEQAGDGRPETRGPDSGPLYQPWTMNTTSNTPLVSVIVPMYGVENYIARCAESLFAQTYPSIEFIFVDDGCKDRSVDVLRGILGKQEPALQARVRIISKENGGLPHARKTGLDAASGEYVLHVDSDDWLEPTAVEKLVREAVATEADIVVYDFWKEYPNRSKLDSERDSSAADPDLFRHRLYTYKSYGYVWNKFCRRSLYDGVFVPKYAMHEDIVFSTQILYKAKKVVHLKEGLYHYDRTVSASATRAPQKIRRVNSARNLLDLYLHFEGQDPSPVSDLREEIFLRAAWAGLQHDRNLFKEYPFLAPAVRDIPLTPGYHIGKVRQSLIKLFLLTHYR